MRHKNYVAKVRFPFEKTEALLNIFLCHLDIYL